MAEATKQRNSSIELLRLLLMIMILGGHVCNILKRTYADDRLLPLMCVLHTAVPTFILISGYYKIKLSVGKVVYFYLYCTIYSIICYIISSVYYHDINILKDSWKAFLPLSQADGRWFLSYYFLLMLMAPLLNCFAELLSKRQMGMTVAIMMVLVTYSGIIYNNTDFGLIINSGKSVVYFAALYMLGRWLYMLVDAKKNFFSIYLCVLFYLAAIITLYLVFIAIPSGWTHLYNGIFYHYASGFVILMAMLQFLIFLNLHINSRFLNYLASSSFAIYLLHEYHPTQFVYSIPSLYIYDHYNGLLVVTMEFLLLLGIAVTAIIIDKLVRVPLQDMITNALQHKIDRLQKFIVKDK